jgi:hypothetical protein
MTVEDMRMDSSEQGMQTDNAGGRGDALDAFWATHRLLHHKADLCKFLGTETIDDLDDVYPHDLSTTRAVQWIQTYLAIAEGNRLRQAVAQHHAAKHPQPLSGVEHLPRCRLCACQGETDTVGI